MGEAKRRKAMGLMPDVTTLDIRIDGDDIEMKGTLPSEELRRNLIETVRESEGTGAKWARIYRSAKLRSGEVIHEIKSRADVERIAVPQHRRMRAEYLTNYDAYEKHTETGDLADYVALDERGNAIKASSTARHWLHLRDVQVSFDGREWQPLPPTKDWREVMYAFSVAAHLAKAEEPVRTLKLELTPDTLEVTPEMPDLRAEIEAFVRDWYGFGDAESWAESFERWRTDWNLKDSGVPQRVRTTLELRQANPLSYPVAAIIGGLDADLAEGQFTLDGETWYSYDPDELPDELFEWDDEENEAVSDGKTIDMETGE